uniref:60S acidic ribosomal protein P2 n=1 Tax=Noctiluca scintillans TaxID=2966 RepID=A0A7S0ZT67_NOCSC
MASLRYPAAYLLAVLGGKASPTAADIKKVLTSIEAECDDDAAEKLVSELSGKDIVEVVTAGREALKNFGGGGGGGPAIAVSGGGGGGDGPKEAKKEEKVEEEEEEEEMDFDLFG